MSVTVTVTSGDILATTKQASATAREAGAVVIVPPGRYPALTFQPGDLQGPVLILADTTGAFTGSQANPVVVVGQATAIDLEGQTDLAIDGFTAETARGATDPAILVRDGSGVTVQDCIVGNDSGDAIAVEDSSDTLIFNNLLFRNGGTGVAITGSDDAQVINNTIFRNLDAGVFIGADSASQPSSNALLENNIINGNTSPPMNPGQPPAPAGIGADSADSLSGYQADYNLNTDGYQGPTAGPHDLNTDPLFASPGGSAPDLHLVSPFAGSGGSPAIDAGDPATSSNLASIDLVQQLEQLTAQTDHSPDAPPVDLGFHFTDVEFPPTPTPIPTRRTGTPAPAHTHTPTPTPKHH